MDDKQKAHFLESLKCPFEIRIHTPCKMALHQWILERDKPPTIKEIAEEYGWAVDHAIERAVDLIIKMGFGFGFRNVCGEINDLVLDEDTYILGTREQSEKLSGSRK